MINDLFRVKYVGYPYHGQAINGVLTHSFAGNIDVTYDGDRTNTGTRGANIDGGCVYIKNPAAPGVVRDTNQLAKDVTEDNSWRNYALLCGKARAFNGNPSIELGYNQYIYADPSGNSWVIEIEYIKNTTNITVNVWLKAIFGRFGRTRLFTPSILATIDWTPDIPSWYSGGYTESDVVTAIDTNWQNVIAFDETGSTAYIHLFSKDISINGDVYDETTPDGLKGYFNLATSLVGVLKVVLSDSGDLDLHGDGILCTLTEDLVYEGGLVTNRVRQTDESPPYSDMPCGFIDWTVTDCPAYPGDNCSPPTEIVFNQVYSPFLTTDSGYNAVDNSEGSTVTYDAILYRTPDGDVVRHFDLYSNRRDWEVTVSGGFTRTVNLSTCGIGNFQGAPCSPPWFYDGTVSQTGNAIVGDYELNIREGLTIQVSVCGTQVVDSRFERVTNTVGCWECLNVQDVPGGNYLPSSCTGPPYSTDTVTATFNGQTTTGTNFYQRVQVRQLAQNLHYFDHYHSKVNDEANHFAKESHVGIDYQGNVSVVWQGQYSSTYRPPSSAYPEVDYPQELVHSYQPRTGAHQHAQVVYGVLYSGDVYQYC